MGSHGCVCVCVCVCMCWKYIRHVYSTSTEDYELGKIRCTVGFRSASVRFLTYFFVLAIPVCMHA